MLTTSSAATPLTPTPAAYTRASVTWRAEPRSFTPATSQCVQTLAPERSPQWFWATSSCLLPACKKKSEGKLAGLFGRRQMPLKNSSEETDSEAPAQGEFPYRALQEYPKNNMVTGYASARDMKKYEGELHDFIPGTSGYAVYWVQSKLSIYCKTKKKSKF